MRVNRPASLILLFLAGLTAALAAQDDVFDLVIRNGRIIDGTGSPWYAGDVGIRAGRIAAIGRLGDVAARQTVDAAGMVVAPGFIDMLGQSDLSILVTPSLPSKIFQGITTEITGEGSSRRPAQRLDRRGRPRRLPAPPAHARLADPGRLFRAAGEAGHRDQPGELRRRDAGPPDGAGRRGPAADRASWCR